MGERVLSFLQILYHFIIRDFGILGLCSGRRVYPESRYFCVLISNHFPNCISDERSVAQEVLHGALLKKKMVSKIITMLARLEMSTLSSGTNSVF